MAQLQSQMKKRMAQARREDAGEGAHTRQHDRVFQAHPDGGRRAADRVRPAADRTGPATSRPAARAEALDRVAARVAAAVSSSRCRPIGGSCLEEFRLVDLARKVVGVGSVGTRAWIALMLGRDEQDPLFLQFKEAQSSVLEEFTAKSEYGNHGQRVVAGQHLMQACERHLPGLGARRERHRRPGARLLRPPAEGLERLVRDGRSAAPRAWRLYGQVCGWTLARAHARSGDRIAIASYLGGSDVFDRAIADFSETYADQNERDYEALTDAVKTGRIERHDRAVTIESRPSVRQGRGRA